MQLSQLDNIFFTILIKTIDRTTPTIDKNLSTTGARVGLSVRRRGDRGLRRGFLALLRNGRFLGERLFASPSTPSDSASLKQNVERAD